jgi:hypothetical protein
MRRSCGFFLQVIVALFLSNLCAAQRIQVDYSACDLMYNVLVTMKAGAAKAEVSRVIDSVLGTKPYQIMFKHYNRDWRPNHLPPRVFKQMILSLGYQCEYTHGENQRADQMLPRWKVFYDDLPRFARNLRDLEKTDLTKLVENCVHYGQTWLPPDWRIPDVYLFIIPNGGSPAFVIEGVQGYDFFQLPRDSSGTVNWSDLATTISHESHHLGMKGTIAGTMSSPDSVAYKFLTLFIGEGTATKFINDYPGGCVPVVDESRRDTSFDKGEIGKWWHRYTSEESNLFARLVETFEKAYSGKLTATELNTETGQFWLNGFVSPVYFVGAELFGAIYHAHGKEGAFTAMRDPRKTFLLYNDAIRKRADILGSCYVIPDSSVQHALAIGTTRQ